MSELSPVKPINLLLVEDHALTRMGTRMALEKVPGLHMMGEAVNGEEALVFLARHQPDVVLMDIGLPVMDGIESTQQIKARFPGVKVIMLTSKDEDKTVYAALTAGADAYCMKDIPTERLHIAIQSVMDGVMWLDPGVARLVVQGLPASQIASPEGGNLSAPVSAEVMQKNIESTESLEDLTENTLSSWELEILRLIVGEKTTHDIARTFHSSVDSVNRQIVRILKKLSVSTTSQAAEKAKRTGLI
jgi:DNA-binding NarL/FixJ family response regulator